MARVRQYNFPTGFETSTTPDPSTPTADSDTISLGYLNNLSAWGYWVADYNALTALDSDHRADNQVRLVDTGTPIAEFWKFDDASTATPDGLTVLQPDDLPSAGRWLLIETSGGGGGAGAAGVEMLKNKLEEEHYDIITPPLDNSVGSGFHTSKQPISAVVLEDYTSGTALSLAWNPLFINDSDKNTDSTTGWSAQTGAGNLTTSATKKIGTASLSFDKTSVILTNADIRYDTGAATKNINGFTELFFWINLPSITNLANVEVRVDVDGTNYQTFTATTDHTGASLATGWQLMKFDLSTGGSASGTGWDKTKLFRYLWIGVNTTTIAQTYTAILIDSIHFSIYRPSTIVQVGNEYSIYDTSNQQSFIIDEASARVAGTVTLAAGLADAYAGGTGSGKAIIKRNTVLISGDDGARMEDGLSGEIADTQVVRLQRILNESLSSQQFMAYASVNTNGFWEVTEVTDSDTVKVDDVADSTANLVSGKILHVFKVHYDADGQKNYEYRNLNLTIVSSSHSSGTTTINTDTNTGIAVGDIVILKALDLAISLEPVTDNENYQAMTVDDIIVTDLGLQYPQSQYVFGHWSLGGATAALGSKIIRGSLGKDLTVNGSLTANNTFKNGQYATSGWADANYYSLSSADSQAISGDSGDVTRLQLSFWWYASSFTGTAREFLGRDNANGWGLSAASGANTFSLTQNGGTGVVSGVSFTPNAWNHIVIYIEDTVTAYLYVNAVKSATGTPTITSPGTAFTVGRMNTNSGRPLDASSLLADLVIWRNAPALTVGEIESLYNRGLHRVLSYKPGLDYRASKTSLTGQRLSLKATLDRTTDALDPFITSMGAIKS